jgi:hypothetical protein
MNTATMTNGVGSDERIAARPPIDASPLRFPASADAGETIQKFLGSATSLWAKQRERIEEMLAAYEADRFRKVSDFQRRMKALGNEAEDTLRSLDREHVAKLAEARRMLAALDALRDS